MPPTPRPDEQPPADVPDEQPDPSLVPTPEPETPSAPVDKSGAGIVPEGSTLSAADDHTVDSTVEQGAEDLGPAVWMKHDGISGATRSTQVQFDTVWAPRGWVITDPPEDEIGSIPGA